jgi:hypothetical protein
MDLCYLLIFLASITTHVGRIVMNCTGDTDTTLFSPLA